MRTLLDYATDDDLGDYRQFVYALRRAEAETKKVHDALRRVFADQHELEQAKVYELRAAGQRAMGSDVVVPSGRTKRAELDEQINGLRVLLSDAEDSERTAKANLRRAAHTLMRRCAERCADDYIQSAQTLGWCWTQLAAVANLGGPSDHFLKDLSGSQINVPGSESLDALKRQTRQEWGRPVVLSNDRLGKHLEASPSEIRKHAEHLVGAWPL